MDLNNQDGDAAPKMTLRPQVGSERQVPAPGGLLGSDQAEPAAISTHFSAEKIHPVLVFGNTGSGKTMVLTSLLNFATEVAPQIGVFLGENAFPPDYPKASERIEDAIRFYNDGLTEFRNARLAGKTLSDAPFFIPIDVIFTKEFIGEQSFRLAFLEGKGEWYERDSVKTYKYRSFRDEIIDVLSYYPSSISVIFVLPSDSDGNDAQSQKSHDCLSNCIEEYRRHRPKSRRKADNLLLLVSKWDSSYPPADPSGQFASPTADEVVRNVAHRRVWEQFNALDGLAIGAKALMPYCAAEVLGSQIVRPRPETKPILDKYNKTLWNWLFMNLTGVPLGGRISVQTAFFSDVAPSKSNVSYHNLLRFILGAGKLASNIPRA